MQINRRDGLLAAATMTMASVAPAIGQDRTQTVIDAIGRHVRVPDPVERIVIASHYAYEDFTAIAGAEGWSKVVGIAREPWVDWRAATYAEYAKVIPNLDSLPDVGTLGPEFDADKVIALKPDVVLLEALPDSLIGDQLRALRVADIAVIYIDLQAETLFRRSMSIAAIGLVTGAQARAGELFRFYTQLHNDVLDRLPTTEPYTQSVYAEVAETAPEIIGWTDSVRLWGGMAINLYALNIAHNHVPEYGGQLPADVLLAIHGKAALSRRICRHRPRKRAGRFSRALPARAVQRHLVCSP